MGNKRSLNEEELNRKRELDRNRKRQKSLLLTEEQLIEKRRANLKSQTKRRKNQTEVELLARRQADNVRHALYRENESEEQRIQRRTADNSRHILSRENESEEQRIQRRTADNSRHILSRENESEEQRIQRRTADNSRHILSRENESEEQRIQRRTADNSSHTLRRENESEEQRIQRRTADNSSHTLRRENESEEQRIQRCTADNSRHILSRENESEEQRIQRRTADNISQTARRANETIEQNRTRVLAVRSYSAVFDQEYEKIEAQRLIEMLNSDQKRAFNSITAVIDCRDQGNSSNNCFFLDGPGGSGKTHVYRTLMSYYRGKGEIVLPFATTGIAATLLKGGRTVHSGFKLPVPLNETSVSFIKHNSKEAESFRNAVLIIIDEITMLPKEGLRCIDAILRELMKSEIPFGGKIIVVGGDFRQTLPVVPHGNRTDIIETCVKSSSLWKLFKILSLKINMRSEGQGDFNDWLLSIGCGTTPSINGLPEGTVELPQDLLTVKPIVESVFGKNIGNMSSDELTKRVILASTNEVCLNINKEVIRQLPGQEYVYNSADSIVSDDPSDALNYPTEFLNSITLSGMPPHSLVLKVGTVVMLIRNLCPAKGLCNGTRLIIKSLQRYSITAEILSECNRGDLVNIPRIDLAPSDVNLPFVLKRRQFPVIPAFAVTINKSQGQTYDNVGIYLNEPVFSHGQLYVAISRSRNRNNIKIFIAQGVYQGKLLKNDKIFTQNVVYKEIFNI